MNKTIQLRQEKEREILLEYLKKTPVIQHACEKAGVGRATYYRWRKENKDFAARADKAIIEGIAMMNDMAESQLLRAIRDRNMTGIMFWLRHNHKRFSTKVELSGTLEHKNIEIPEEYKKLIKKALNLTALESETKK